MSKNRKKENVMFVFPSPKSIQNQLSNYLSSSDITKFREKTYVDEKYGVEPMININIDGLHLNGKWDIELNDFPETMEYELRIISRLSSSDNIIMTFNDAIARKRFVENISAESKVMQTSNGMNLQEVANTKTITNIGRGTVIAAGVLGVGYGIYKYINSKKDLNKSKDISEKK